MRTQNFGVTFCGGSTGQWRIRSQIAVTGQALPDAEFLSVSEQASQQSVWTLTGFASNLRYTGALDREALKDRSEGLGRPAARHAALIPIRKSDAWWAMAQDERLAVFGRARHTPIGMDYLPAIARKLYHSRDLAEPFDFLTWFEFAAEDEPAFDHMLERLRNSEEWQYVTHEVDIRLSRHEI